MTDTPEVRGSSPRRTFLKATGAGAAIAGMGLFGADEPAAASSPPFSYNLKDDYGARGNGVSDDTTSIQAAFTTLSPQGGGVSGAQLLVPPGEYVITNTITIDRFAGIIQGPGIGNTPVHPSPGKGAAFRWNGPAGVPMFKVTNSRHISFRDLRFVGKDSAPPSAAVNFLNTGAGRDTIGTNSETSLLDCHIGVWPWPSEGKYTGVVTNGVLFSGHNSNNDKFRLERCVFRGKTGIPTTGVRIAGTQSVWGSVTNCHFDRLGQGIVSASSTAMVNPQFINCGTDIVVERTAQIDVFAWNSEFSSRLAAVSRRGGLRALGGSCHVVPSKMARSGGLISGYPSDGGQTISLTGMRFRWIEGEESPPYRPTISFGPSGPTLEHPQGSPAGHEGFLIQMRDCVGLYPNQCEFVGTMNWASDPRSRGLVEWHSRNHFGGITQFRNELWNGSEPGGRSTLNVNVWDQPIAGTVN